MRKSRRGRALTIGMAMAATCAVAAAPAGARGILPSETPVIKPIKVGKYRVTPEASQSSTTARYTKGSGQVGYTGTGTGTTDQITGDFGGFGKIDVTFHKSGPFKSTKLPNGCHGTPNKQQKGTWRGKFKVDGEGSLPKVSRTSLPGSIVKFGDFTCDGNFPNYVNLNSVSWSNINFGASVRKSGGKPQFYSQMTDSARGAQISRSAFYRGKPPQFKYQGDYSTAKVTPKGAFSGTGRYAEETMRGGTATTGILSGNIKVKFLGLSAKVALPTGPASLGDGIFRPAR